MGIKTTGRTENALTVGADQYHTARPGPGHHFRFDPSAITAHFPKTGGNDQAGLDLHGQAIVNHHGHVFGRYGHDGQVHGFGYILDRIKGFDAQNGFPPRIYRENAALPAAAQDTVKYDKTPFIGFFRCADKSDGLRIEECVQMF